MMFMGLGMLVLTSLMDSVIELADEWRGKALSAIRFGSTKRRLSWVPVIVSTPLKWYKTTRPIAVLYEGDCTVIVGERAVGSGAVKRLPVKLLGPTRAGSTRGAL